MFLRIRFLHCSTGVVLTDSQVPGKTFSGRLIISEICMFPHGRRPLQDAVAGGVKSVPSDDAFQT